MQSIMREGRWRSSRVAQGALLGGLALLLQNLAVPYPFTYDGSVSEASLAHLHAGLLLAVAMLNRDRRVFAWVAVVLYLGWCARVVAAGQPELWQWLSSGVAVWLLTALWTLLCARWMGWPKPAGVPMRLERGDLSRLTAFGLVAYPIGLVVLQSGLLALWKQEAIIGNGLQVLFAKYFGVAIVAMPALGLWTERHRRTPYRARASHSAWIWPLLLAAFVLLAMFGAWRTGTGAWRALPGIVSDYRFAFAALLAWTMMYVRPRVGFALLMLGMLGMVWMVSGAGSTLAQPRGFFNVLSVAFETGVMLMTAIYLFVFNRDTTLMSAQLQADTRCDMVTGLPNLNAFHQDAATRLQAGGEVGYLLLDSGEQWAAGFGLGAQSSMQQQIGARIAGLVDPYLASSGQFALLPRAGVDAATVWEQVAHRLETLVVDADGHPMRLSPYLGVARPADASLVSLDAALLVASQLAFEARSRHEVRPLREQPGSTGSTRQRERLQVTTDALSAIRTGRIELYFQPIVPAVPAADAAIGNYGEVLCRLRTPDGRLLEPERFIAAIEAAGRSVELDLLVWRTLLALLRQFGDVAAQCRLSVNIAGASLASPSFQLEFEELLEEFPRHGSRLCIEVTETSAIAGAPDAREFLQRLRVRGCAIAIDDFGTGVQTFSRLRELPMDILKIDGEFVAGLVESEVDRALVRASVEVARAFGAQTVAEHVETREIADCLRGMGVGWLQGRHCAPTRPLRQVLEELRLWNGSPIVVG